MVKTLKESKWNITPSRNITELKCCYKAAAILQTLPHKTQDTSQGESSVQGETGGVQTEAVATNNHY